MQASGSISRGSQTVAVNPLTQTVVFPVPAAQAVHRAVAATRAGAQLAALVQQVDDLLELRSLLKASQEAERQLTAQVVSALQAAGATRVDGLKAVATLGQRTTQTVDPELFIQGVGLATSLPALTVSVTKARELMLPADLDAISETFGTPVLLVKERR